MYYTLSPACAANLVLQFKDDSASLAEYNEKDTYQQWMPIAILTGGEEVGFVLFHVATNEILNAPNNDSFSLELFNPYPDEEHRLPQPIPSSAIWKFVRRSDTFGAMQLQSTTTQDLNVKGDGPYGPGTPVGVYHWKGGQPNEIWEFTPRDFLISCQERSYSSAHAS